MKREQGKPSDTICWTCMRAVPNGKVECSWAKDLIPVRGWVAEKSKTLGGSYSVRECPLYKEDKERQPQLNGEDVHFKNFAFAVAIQCVNDYRIAYEKVLLNKPWYELCIKRKKEYERIRNWTYGKCYRARKRRNQKVLTYMKSVSERAKKRFGAYFHDAVEGQEAFDHIESCRAFFATETFTDYTDMDGIRIMHQIEEEIHKKHGREKE